MDHSVTSWKREIKGWKHEDMSEILLESIIDNQQVKELDSGEPVLLKDIIRSDCHRIYVIAERFQAISDHCETQVRIIFNFTN